MAGFGGLPGRAAYTASKAAMTTFFESLRLDLDEWGVAVTVVHPGFVLTEMTGRDNRRRPFIMDVDAAVDRMMKAIETQRPSLMFPKRLAGVAWLARILPEGPTIFWRGGPESAGSARPSLVGGAESPAH